MRKLLGGLVLALVMAVLVPGTALATHSNGTGPDKDFLDGTVKQVLPTPLGSFQGQVHNNAQSESASGPGIPATGHFYVDIFDTPVGDVTISGDVVCLQVIGNNAWTRSVITQSNTVLAPPGFTLIGRETDNGEPGSLQAGAAPPDAATGFLAPPLPPGNPTCPTLPLTTNPVEQGNYVIHDGV